MFKDVWIENHCGSILYDVDIYFFSSFSINIDIIKRKYAYINSYAVNYEY